MDGNRKKDSSQSTENALRLLDCFIDREERGISELSRELGLGKASVSRLVAALESRKFLTKNDSTGKYHLGIRLMLFGALFEERDELSRAATPAMLELSKKYQATAHLAVRSGTDIVIVNKITSGPFTYMTSRVGSALTAYASATGKCILAFSTPEQIEQYLDSVRLSALTAATITEPNALLAELSRIRNLGYATDDEEYTLGLYCVAAPVLNLSGKPFAALSVSGSKAMLHARTEEIAQDIIRVAAQIASC